MIYFLRYTYAEVPLIYFYLFTLRYPIGPGVRLQSRITGRIQTAMFKKDQLYFPWDKRFVHTTIGCGKQGFPSAQPYLSQYYEHGQNIPEPSGARCFMGDDC